MAAWQKPECSRECLPNKVFRFRKQAQSKYHKVVITDEANLSTLLPMCYRSMTLLFVDNMTKIQLETEIRELLSHLEKRCKAQKVVFLYACGLSTLLSRYSLADPSKGTSCCSKCDIYLYNNAVEDLFLTMTALRDLISSSMTMCYFIPTALPPFSIKWHAAQFQAEHQQCCAHAIDVLSSFHMTKSSRDKMQASLDEKLTQYNKLVNADCREKNLPVIDWSKTYLTNTNLKERQESIVMKVTSLLCDFISVIYQDECSHELQQIQNALSVSDDEIQVKEEPTSVQENQSLNQPLNEDVSTKSGKYFKDLSTPRRSPRKMYSLKSSCDNSSSLSDPNTDHNSTDISHKRKLGTDEHTNTSSKRKNIASKLLPDCVPITDASDKYPEKDTLDQDQSNSVVMNCLEQEMCTLAPETNVTLASKGNTESSSSSCTRGSEGNKKDDTSNDVLMSKSNCGTAEGCITEANLHTDASSKSNSRLTVVPGECGSQEVLEINTAEHDNKNDSLVGCTIQKADSSSDIQILENNILSSSDVICLSKPHSKTKSKFSRVPSSHKRRSANNSITSSSRSFLQRINKKIDDSANEDLVVLEENSAMEAGRNSKLDQINIQSKTNLRSTNANISISSHSTERDPTPTNSASLQNSEEKGINIASDLMENISQEKNGSFVSNAMDIENNIEVITPTISGADNNIEGNCVSFKENNKADQKIASVISAVQNQDTNQDNSDAQPNARTASIIEMPVISNVELDSIESNARSGARRCSSVSSVIELPIIPKIEQDIIEDVKPVLMPTSTTSAHVETPGFVAIRQSPIPKGSCRQRESSISSTISEDSTQPPEFVESDVSVFKRTDEHGTSLHILITDERLQAVTDLLVNDLSYKNCIHICGHDTTIPQMNNSIREALVETRKLKMNQSKHLIVAICLGTVDIINLLGTLKLLPASARKPKKVKYTTSEVVTLVYNRLMLLKRSIKEFDSNARVILFKLPPTQVGGNVKIAIDQMNTLIHRSNRDDKTVCSGTKYPLKKLCKVSEPAFTLNNESTAHWLETCKFIINIVEESIRNEDAAAAASVEKKPRQMKCVVDLEAPQSSCKKKLLFSKDEAIRKKIFEISDKKSEQPEVVDVEEDRSKKKSTRSNSSGKCPKPKKSSDTEIFINKHDNIVCKTPGSSRTIPNRSSLVTSRFSVPDQPIISVDVSSATPTASKFLPDEDSVSKKVNAFMRLLLHKEDQAQQEEEECCGVSSLLSSNVCALLAVSRILSPLSTVNNDVLLAAAHRLHEHEQLPNSRGCPTIEHLQKKAIIEAVGETVEYLEDAVIGQVAADVLYAAVLNVKKVYAA